MDRRDFLSAVPASALLTLNPDTNVLAAESGSKLTDEWEGVDFFKSATAEVSTAPGGGFLAQGDLPFAIYQLSKIEPNKYKIIDPAGRDPQLAGNADRPDVGMGLTLAGVQFARSVWEDSGRDARATIRITTKNEPSNAEGVLHWALSAALNLYEAYKGDTKVTNPIELNTPLVAPQQTVQFKGGLGAIQIEVLRHRQPSWWNTVMKFLLGAGGDALIGALGFPAVTKSALRFVDEFSNRVSSNGAVPIFSASYASVAFTKAALKNANNPAALDSGLWLVTSPSARDLFAEQNAYYYGGFARLVPGRYTEPTKYLEAKNDPFADITYAILDAKLQETKFL